MALEIYPLVENHEIIHQVHRTEAKNQASLKVCRCVELENAVKCRVGCDT